MEQLPDWFVDERAHAGAEHLDPSVVETYDRKARFDPTEETALLRTLGLDEASTLVDLGAGTGAVALAAAPFCARVVAVDVSPAMLAALARSAERLGLANVEPVEAGFLSYVHRGQPADVVYSRNAFHHLPDFWKALALERLAGIMRPGGIFRLRDLVFAMGPSEAGDAVESWLAAAPERAEEGWTRAERARHVREEHSTFTWLLEPMLERAGFEIENASYNGSLYAAYVCVRR